MVDAARPVAVLPAGLTFEAMFAEAARRHPSQAVTDFSPQMLVEGFVTVCLDFGSEEALKQARQFKPGLIVAEEADFLGLLAAAELSVPWVSHKLGIELPLPVIGALNGAFAARMTAHGLKAIPRSGVINIWPDALQPDDWQPSEDQVMLRPQPFEREGVEWSRPTFVGREDRPLVLVTLGTGVNVLSLLSDVIGAVTASADVNVIVTFNTQENADAAQVDRGRVQPVGFVPLSQLLKGVSMVVSDGGAGTVLSAMSQGLPMVILPLIADQPLNAERVAHTGAGVSVKGTPEIGTATQRVLGEPSYHNAAQRVAEQIAAMNLPEDVLTLLLQRAGLSA